MRVAGVVLKWLRTDKEANYERAAKLITEAARGGAQLVCTTECFLDGYAIKDKSIPLDQYRALGEPIPSGQYFQRLAELADRLNIYLVAGMLEADGDHRYNTAVFIDPDGKLLGKYRKHKLDTNWFATRRELKRPCFARLLASVGIMICADRRDPDLVKRLSEGGADFLDLSLRRDVRTEDKRPDRASPLEREWHSHTLRSSGGVPRDRFPR